MKKLFTFALAVLMIATLAVTVSADGNNAGLTYSAPYGNITVDGTIEAAWDNAAWALIENGREGGTPGAKFKLMHDDKYLYFLGQFDDTTGLDMLMNENFTVYLHLDNCDTVIAKECASSRGYIMNRKNALEGTSQCWDSIKGEMVSATEEDVVYYTMVEDGTLLTWEARFEMPDAIAEGLAKVDVEFGDYGPFDEYKPSMGWNTYGANPVEPGTIYLLAASADTQPAESTPAESTPAESTPAESTPAESTPADTTKPAETPVDTEKAPATADAGLVVAAVVMAAAAMIVLSKKH